MVKHTQTIRRLLSTNSVSMFDHFVGLVLKELGKFEGGLFFPDMAENCSELSQTFMMYELLTIFRRQLFLQKVPY